MFFLATAIRCGVFIFSNFLYVPRFIVISSSGNGFLKKFRSVGKQDTCLKPFEIRQELKLSTIQDLMCWCR